MKEITIQTKYALLNLIYIILTIFLKSFLNLVFMVEFYLESCKKIMIQHLSQKSKLISEFQK